MLKKVCLVIVVMCLALTGCGKGQGDINAVTVWHWMTDRHNAFLELAERYYDETGIWIDFQFFSPSVYSQKIVAAAQARILPDIYGILDNKKVVADFIKAGFVANLRSDFEADDKAWEGVFFTKALEGNRFGRGNSYGVDEGIYGVPVDMMNIQLVYNKRLLAEAGVKKVPETFNEFLAAADLLKARGITPFVSGWAELWLAGCFASNYAFNIMGEEKIMATFRGEVPYTDPDWVQVLGIFDTLSRRGVLAEGIVTKSNKLAEQDFALERAAFAFNGSWCINVYHGMNPNLSYGVMIPPPITLRHRLLIWGAEGGAFRVNAASFRREKAIDFLKWLTATEQQAFLAETTKNLPANKNAVASLPAELMEFGRGLAWTTHPSIWELDEDAVVSEKFLKGIQSIIIGEKTPEAVAAEVQQVKARQMERARRRVP